MDAKNLPINITHYINPHIFYFKIDVGTTEESEEFDSLLESYALQKVKEYPKGYEPEVGDIVLVYFQPWNKWIRGEVDFIANFLTKPTSYILWSFENG